MKLNDKPIELNSDEFRSTVKLLVDSYAIDCIIETGTYLGTGSTMVFAETRLPVVTLECVKENVDKARENLASFPNVTVLHATSLSITEMLNAIVEMSNREYPDNIRCDVTDPTNFYICEIDHDVEFEDVLGEIIDSTPNRKLVFLDSSGGVGYAEAKFVISKCLGKPVVLMFDDIDHVKHYYTGDLLRSVGKDVNISGDGRFAWSFLG